MAVDINTLVPSLKREVEPPGGAVFADTPDYVWVGYLVDGFWEARLDGFLDGYTIDNYDPADQVAPITADITPVGAAPDLDRGHQALIVLYAGIKILRNRILNMNTAFRAKAGAVEFEQQNSATVLAEMLKQLRATKDRIIEVLESEELAGDVLVLDAYSTRVLTPGSYGGGPGLAG